MVVQVLLHIDIASKLNTHQVQVRFQITQIPHIICARSNNALQLTLIPLYWLPEQCGSR